MKKLLLLGTVSALLGTQSVLLETQCLAAETYPPIVTTKQLFAQHDLRGKPAPQLEVQQWLTGSAPDTTNKVVLIDFFGLHGVHPAEN
jgi:hypothetical protein